MAYHLPRYSHYILTWANCSELFWNSLAATRRHCASASLHFMHSAGNPSLALNNINLDDKWWCVRHSQIYSATIKLLLCHDAYFLHVHEKVLRRGGRTHQVPVVCPLDACVWCSNVWPVRLVTESQVAVRVWQTIVHKIGIHSLTKGKEFEEFAGPFIVADLWFDVNDNLDFSSISPDHLDCCTTPLMRMHHVLSPRHWFPCTEQLLHHLPL